MIGHLRLFYDAVCDGPDWYEDGDVSFWRRPVGVGWSEVEDLVRVMLEGLRSDGLRVGGVEPGILRKMRGSDREFQRRWVEAVEGMKRRVEGGFEMDLAD